MAAQIQMALDSLDFDQTMGLAAAALYIAALQNKTKCPQNEIAKTCQITEVTLRNRYKEFIRVLNLKVSLN